MVLMQVDTLGLILGAVVVFVVGYVIGLRMKPVEVPNLKEVEQK